MAKRLTLDQVERKREKAVRFLEDVVRDPEKAAEFDSMTTAEYADHKGIEIAENPGRMGKHPGQADPGGRLVTLNFDEESEMTKPELEGKIAELEEEIEDLNSRLDSVLQIVTPGEADADKEDDEEDLDVELDEDDEDEDGD